MNDYQEKEQEIINEINKMTIEELIYLNYNPNYFIYNKLKPQIEEIQNKNKQIQLKQENLQNIKEKIENENLSETFKLKEQIETLNFKIDKLIKERDNLMYKMPKSEFLPLLERELKQNENPESCFAKLKEGKINFDQFEREFSKFGKDKNYYYYKLIYDRIKND